MEDPLAPPDTPPPPIPSRSPDRKSAPERLETPKSVVPSTQKSTQQIQTPNQEFQEPYQELKTHDPEPFTLEEQLAAYIHHLQHQHNQEIAFLQQDLHLEKSKRVHINQEHIQERLALESKIQDLTLQLSTTQAQIPGTFENKCSNLEKLREEFLEIRTEELAILVCETYSTIDLLNLLDGEGKGSSSEPGTKRQYGNDYRIWSGVFLKYIEILHTMYSQTHPSLLSAVLKFHREILRLSESYSWKDQVLPLALFHHGMVKKEGVTKAENWGIPEKTRRRFCPDKKTDGDGESVKEKGRLTALSDKFKDNEMLRGYTSLKERYVGPKLGSVLGESKGKVGNESKVTIAESVRGDEKESKVTRARGSREHVRGDRRRADALRYGYTLT